MTTSRTGTAWRRASILLAACLAAATAVGPVRAQQSGEPKRLTDAQMLNQVATQAQPQGRWKDGLTFDGLEPMPWLKNTVNWYPGIEAVQPNEIRVTFMGSAPLTRPGQLATSVYI